MEKKERKMYSTGDNETSHIEEPFIGYQTLSERKKEFIHTVNSMTSEEFAHLEAIYYTDRYSSEMICPETIQQIREQARRATEDVKAGRITEHEELKKRFRQ